MKQNTWIKSSASGPNTDACVEALRQDDGTTLVRSTRNREGGTLAFDPDEWTAFTAGVRAGEFD